MNRMTSASRTLVNVEPPDPYYKHLVDFEKVSESLAGNHVASDLVNMMAIARWISCHLLVEDSQ